MYGWFSFWNVVWRFLYRSLRRFIKRKFKSEHRCNNCFSRVKRKSKRKFLVIILVITIFCVFLLLSQYAYGKIDLMMDIPEYFNDSEETNETEYRMEVFTRRIDQVPPPRPKINDTNDQIEEKMHIAFAKRQLAYMRIRKLLKQQKNNFTPLVLEVTVATTTTEFKTDGLPFCFIPKNFTGLINATDNVNLDKLYPKIQDGGYFRPSHCISRHKLAIIVPYRNRPKNLSTFLYNLHPFLMNQNLEYRIFVIEQAGDKKFNKGRLFNAGFKEVSKYGQWKCIVFHDVDLLPTNGQILYTCPRAPRHMSSAVYDTNGTLTVNATIPLFGGVTAMTPDHYEKVNGHSNLYWGWGGEDIDMYHRLRAAPLQIARYDRNIAVYLALPHEKEVKNPRRYLLLSNARERFESEGLSTIEYKVLSATMRHLYTHILVDVTYDTPARQYEDYFFQNDGLVT